MNSPAPYHQRGLTLVELLIAVTLGLIVLATVIGVFVSNSQNYRQNDAITGLQDNARFAMDTLGRDLAMAGYWGGVRPKDAQLNLLLSTPDLDAVSPTATPGDCAPSGSLPANHWLFNVGTAIEFRNHTDTTGISQFSRCLSAIRANTDAVVIRRVSGQTGLDIPVSSALTSATPLPANRYYVKTNQSVGSLFRVPASGGLNFDAPATCPDPSGASTNCLPLELPMQFYAYTPRIYFVKDGSTPTLCRYGLRDDVPAQAPAMEEDCLAEGVENLQLEWGIDSDGDTVVDRYLSTPTAAQLAQALSVRIHILVRATGKNVQASNDDKQYQLGDYNSVDDPNFADGLHYLRRAFTTTVQLKNFRP